MLVFPWQSFKYKKKLNKCDYAKQVVAPNKKKKQFVINYSNSNFVIDKKMYAKHFLCIYVCEFIITFTFFNGILFSFLIPFVH